MSMRYQAGILSANYQALKTPNAPTGVTASQASSTSASITFVAPTDIGGGAITSYTVVSSGGQTATGASSPITVTGLTTGVAYTFVVYANNAFGNSAASAASNSFTPVAQGQDAYTTAGTYSWVAPASVTSVSVVAVGAGGANGGSGGALAYKNNIPVTPGNSYTVVVAAKSSGPSGSSYFISTATVNAPSGTSNSASQSGAPTGDGGGRGGAGGTFQNGGGGAGGYSGDGGAGGAGNPTPGTGLGGSAGSGGGGGGGGGGSNAELGAGGGGVGILGQGTSGSAGSGGSGPTGGGGGSGGSAGQPASFGNPSGGGGNYGGGSGGGTPSSYPGNGAVRIIWPGTTRQFPSTNTGDL